MEDLEKKAEAEIGEKGFMETAFLAFEAAGKRLAEEEKGKPLVPPKDFSERLSRTLSFLRENPSISFADAAVLVQRGRKAPRLESSYLKAVLDYWALCDKSLGDRIPHKTNMVARLRAEGASEKELTLARVFDVFNELKIGGRVSLQMSGEMMRQIVYDEISLAEANQIIGHQQVLYFVAAQQEKVFNFQRRVTLLDRKDDPRFMPKLAEEEKVDVNVKLSLPSMSWRRRVLNRVLGRS